MVSSQHTRILNDVLREQQTLFLKKWYTWPMYAALLMFCVYILGCYVIGYRFPFDKFELYAGIANRDQAAVPLFLVDGQEANIWEYHQFSALKADAFLNDTIPTSITWMAEESARWVRNHPKPEACDEGPHHVKWGFRMLRIDDQGEILEDQLILTEGYAWKLNS